MIFSLAWMKYHLYWSLKSSCFEFFGDEKYGILWAKKLCYDMIFTNYWKVLALNFSVMGNTVFFFSQKVDGKMIFTWPFWAFHDILGIWKWFFCAVGITYVIRYNYGKIKVDSFDSFPLEKTMTFHNIIILIKSVWNKHKNNNITTTLIYY